MTKNDITGDTIATKPASDNYRANYDAVFRKRAEVEEWPEDRIDAIGQNGGDGAHYALAEFLQRYNDWRRGDNSLPMPDPKQLGIALDEAIALLKKQSLP